MPPRKKPTSRAKPAASAKKTSVRKPAAKKPAARKSPATKAAAKKSAARRTAARPARPRTAPRPTDTAEIPAVPDEEELPLSSGPVAVSGESAGREQPARPLWDEIEPAAVPARAAEPRNSDAPVIDRPGVELGLGVLGLALALSVFLPWYHNGIGTVSGWASATWGPIVFFLALVAVAIVVLRRAGVPVSFPVEPTLVIEGLGWAAVVGIIIKRYFAPKQFSIALPTDGWLFASLLAAVALAVLAGVASSSAPFVIRPGWLRERSGQLGAGILVVALALGIAFGLTNNAFSVPKVARQTQPAPTVSGMPTCARRLALPVPSGLTPVAGIDSKNGANCFVTFRTSLSLKTATARYTTILKQNDLKVSAGPATKASSTLGFRGRICGTVQLIKVGNNPVSVAVILLSCVAPVPS